MSSKDPAVGYYKIRHKHPDKELRLPPRYFFYSADSRDKTLALSTAMAVRAASIRNGGLISATHCVISQYDPRNASYPGLEVVA